MKDAKIKDELKAMSVQELKDKVNALRRDKLNLALSYTAAHVKDYSQFKKLRKNIARALTCLRQKEDVPN